MHQHVFFKEFKQLRCILQNLLHKCMKYPEMKMHRNRNRNMPLRLKNIRLGNQAINYKQCLVPVTPHLLYVFGSMRKPKLQASIFYIANSVDPCSFNHIDDLTHHSLCWFNCEAPYFWVKLGSCSFLNKCPLIWHPWFLIMQAAIVASSNHRFSKILFPTD